MVFRKAGTRVARAMGLNGRSKDQKIEDELAKIAREQKLAEKQLTVAQQRAQLEDTRKKMEKYRKKNGKGPFRITEGDKALAKKLAGGFARGMDAISGVSAQKAKKKTGKKKINSKSPKKSPYKESKAEAATRTGVDLLGGFF